MWREKTLRTYQRRIAKTAFSNGINFVKMQRKRHKIAHKHFQCTFSCDFTCKVTSYPSKTISGWSHFPIHNTANPSTPIHCNAQLPLFSRDSLVTHDRFLRHSLMSMTASRNMYCNYGWHPQTHTFESWNRLLSRILTKFRKCYLKQKHTKSNANQCFAQRSREHHTIFASPGTTNCECSSGEIVQTETFD